MYVTRVERPYARMPTVGEHIEVSGILLPIRAVLWQDNGEAHLVIEAQTEENRGRDWPDDLIAAGFLYVGLRRANEP